MNVLERHFRRFAGDAFAPTGTELGLPWSEMGSPTRPRGRGDNGRQPIVLAANSPWNILNFRMNLVRAIEKHGLAPVALVPAGEGQEELVAMGVPVHTIPMQADSTSPASGALLVARYAAALRRIRPAAFLGFTPKPNIFGSIAASALRIPVINNVTGLGTAFIHGGVLGVLVPNLYRFALRRSDKVFFHNDDDMELFLERKLVRPGQAEVIAGSGVDLERFAPSLAGGVGRRRAPTFLFVGRLMWEKGIGEFVEAAELVKKVAPNACFQVLGSVDRGKRGVPPELLERWITSGAIEYLGTVRDVRPWMETADCVVLPSYREGMPRVLLEAAAMGRPLIGTDVPGCRQIVDDGVTGYRCSARSPTSLAEAMMKIIELPPRQRHEMGVRARAVVETYFSDERVSSAYIAALSNVLH